MGTVRPYVLSIAGFDPSGGAGILADVKTFEANKVYGMSVITGNTFQNESEFEGVDWIESGNMVKQIEVLSKKYKFAFIKIGLVQDLEALNNIISYCRLSFVDCRLIWDPILKASAGFKFHDKIEKDKLNSILKHIYLLTPNTEEVIALTGIEDPMKAAEDLAKHCNVYLKGGHSEKNTGKDILFTIEGKQFSFNPKLKNISSKHGSGCVLSSAIAANLANGYKLNKACLRGKQYTEKFLASNKTLLGNHKI